MVRILIITALLLPLFQGCATIEDITEIELTDQDIKRLQQVEKQMLQGYHPEVEIDRRIAEAVRQMVATLKPEYKQHLLARYKVGFLEVSDIDRKTVSRFHNYVTEKSLTFSFLQPQIARNFNIVERFLLKDVLRELDMENDRNPRIVDQKLARKLGRIYGVDLIETGVTTVSEAYVDINIRLIETQRGRIVAVGSGKIRKTPMIKRWLQEKVATDIKYHKDKKR
ncbi:hypothetical protein DENIS_4132 [Desulfonema ishimotonii]|uniref:FlgO domain-containing protein n=2 Tax=Desulfonema ishimotonii TaxID=45657 RepID=A0A401G1P7_9BACT|nr:hypothetical protein DENIS_4132 [Desulfonema ishimotonii]